MPDKARLLLSSFAMLFVELGLIRWLGSNVIYLSYFANFVLLGSFLGIGLGFLTAKSRRALFPWALVALAFLVGLVRVFPVAIDRTGAQLIYFGGEITGAPIWLILPLIFLAVALVMAAIAQGVARTFVLFPPLTAYRIDILGSIAGIAAFSLLSFLGAPPIAWGAITVAVLLMLYAPAIRAVQVVSAVGLLVLLGQESFYSGYSWSPYYEIAVYPTAADVAELSVNGIPHQIIASVAWHKAHLPAYFSPYAQLKSNPLRNVLIVGAGSGSDVAIALARGAKHVDAVEIDPRIYALGTELNLDHPYRDPRVTVHIGDGRAFLRRTRARYDLILFALPDSLALVSANSSLRLESYLFTTEALRAARARLTPSGAFAMYNYYREQWLVDRYARTLEVAFGRAPCVYEAAKERTFAALTVGLNADSVACTSVWRPATWVPIPATDDRPFPYLKTPSIPAMYLITIGLILLAATVLIRAAGASMRGLRAYWDLFFMGAAFLLLETKSVVQFALLFGATWFVNALVFLGVLLAVLLAIEVAQRVRIRNSVLTYALLFATLVVAWLVDPERLLALDATSRFFAATALAFGPVFMANLVFAQRFRDVASSGTAFAANLLGAMTGGVLEYASLIIGYRALLIVVAALYGLAFICSRRSVSYEVTENIPTTTDAASRALPEFS